MGDLRDQLEKARLLSKKDAKRIAHEERVHRKQVGGAAGVEQERAQHEAELRAKREHQREIDRQQQAAHEGSRQAAEEERACAELLRRQVKKPGRRGASRFYFASHGGTLPFMELPTTERMQVADGSLCIVRVGPPGSHDYGLMPVEHARRVAAVWPDRVVVGAPA